MFAARIDAPAGTAVVDWRNHHDQLTYTPIEMHPATDSWTRVDLPTRTVHQAGSRRLWDEMEPALASWQDAGRPGIDRYGITVDPDGTHLLWLETPDRILTVLP